MFQKTKELNKKALKQYFLEVLDSKLPYKYSKSFNWKTPDSKVFDNFEIILENGQRYSFFDNYSAEITLKDLNISRWSKLKYRHTKESLKNYGEQSETKRTIITDRQEKYQDAENDDEDDGIQKMVKDKIKDNSQYLKFKDINKLHFKFP